MNLKALNEAQKMLTKEYLELSRLLRENDWLAHYVELRPKIERKKSGVKLIIEIAPTRETT